MRALFDFAQHMDNVKNMDKQTSGFKQRHLASVTLKHRRHQETLVASALNSVIDPFSGGGTFLHGLNKNRHSRLRDTSGLMLPFSQGILMSDTKLAAKRLRAVRFVNATRKRTITYYHFMPNVDATRQITRRCAYRKTRSAFSSIQYFVMRCVSPDTFVVVYISNE
jgi:hypothetical protein